MELIDLYAIQEHIKICYMLYHIYDLYQRALYQSYIKEHSTHPDFQEVDTQIKCHLYDDN